MDSRSPIVELEDAIGSQLLLAEFGDNTRPLVAKRYEVIELRGRGASGLVCRAHDVKLHREVALKLYPPLEDRAVEREALREAQALARLEHPNVVRVYDYDQGVVAAGSARQRCLFVSMEFIEGRNFRAWQAEAQHGQGEILRVLLEAGAGLAAAHDAGLIHRDFKPENMMIDGDGHVRVVDFGLARSQGLEVADSSGSQPEMSQPEMSQPNLVAQRITRAGVAPGTPGYMAPEALRGQANALSDQFAFATTVWEALTGELPNASFEDQLDGLPTEAGKLNARLREVLERALSPDPGDRFGSIHVVLDKLRSERARPRRVFTGVAAGSVACFLVLSALAFRARTLEEAAEVSTSVTARPALGGPGEPAPTPTPIEQRCAELEGKWMYDNVVVWASDSVRWHGATGHYELELEQLDGCSMNALLRKTGDGPRRYAKELVREGSRGVKVTETARGLEFSSTFQIASDKHGKLHITFNYVFEAGELSGDYHYDGAEGVIWRGILVGGRSAPGGTLRPDLRQASCTSQCRVRCPSEAARDSCIRERCADEDSDVPDCGRPSRDLAPPPLTTELIVAPLWEQRMALEDKKAKKWCNKAAETLVGRWQLSSPSWTRALEVRATGCDLEIDVERGEGFPAEHLRGLTTSVGGWVMSAPSDSTPRWALIGWDPAFGVTSAGEPLVAHRTP